MFAIRSLFVRFPTAGGSIKKTLYRGRQKNSVARGVVGEYNSSIMLCERCNAKLNERQSRWCSPRCSKLGLKSHWRKRNKKKLREYNREYRRAKNGGDSPPSNPSKYRESECLRCGVLEDLQGAHVKPLWAGGTHKYIITLCRKCHYEFDNATREYWKLGKVPKL